MPDWIMISWPVLLAAIFAAQAAIFLRLGVHGERLARLEANVDLLLGGHRVVEHGPGA